MAWRPPSRGNPLHALRRVVETPDGMPDELARRRGHPGSVRVTSVAGATALAVEPERDVADAPEVVDRPARSRRRRARPASQPEPSRRQPDRPVRGLITSTPASDSPDLPIVPVSAPSPAALAATAARAGTSDRRLARARHAPLTAMPPAGPAAVPTRAPAGPWSTTVDAPLTTPTWLRSSPRIAGGATASATGRSATVASLELLVEPEDLVRRPRPEGPRRRRDPETGRRPMTARQVLAAIVVTLCVWLLLFSPTLYANATASKIGSRRSVAVALLRPISRVTAALGLDRVVHESDRLLGRRHHVPTPLHLTVPVALPARVAARPAAPPATVVPLPAPTATAPLRVLVVGDSIGLAFGQQLGGRLSGTGVVKATVDAREGTGLARPDAFDWPAQVDADIVQFHPQVVVAMFGGNDDQDLQVNGRYITFGSPLWQQLYTARVAQIAQEVTAGHARLAWSGVPVMRSVAKTARFRTVMSATRAALAGRAGTVFVDNFPTLATASGTYTDALPDASGQQVIVREPDGVHLSPAGADRLVGKMLAALAAQWQLDLPR